MVIIYSRIPKKTHLKQIQEITLNYPKGEEKFAEQMEFAMALSGTRPLIQAI